MGTRSGASSSRSTGGTNAAGQPLDTCVVIIGDGRKKVLSLSWSYGANGAGIAVASFPLFGRLLVIAGVDASGYLASGNNLPIGTAADTTNNGIGTFGGRLVWDTDIQAYNGSIGGQFVFPDGGNEGFVGTDSGPLTLILTAPVQTNSTPPTNVIGKLNVQYDMSYSKSPALGSPGYNYTPESAPVNA